MKTIIIDGIEYNLTPKVLFKKGDFVVIQETTYLISKIEGLNVTLSCNGRDCLFDIDVLKSARLWDITKDAKDGDVLINWNNTTFIFKAIEDETVKFHIAYNENWDAIKTPSNKLSHLGLPEPQFEFHPATKEQRNQLEKAMDDAGYTFDFKKKELKKIEYETEIPFGAKDSELQEVTYFIPKGFHAEIDDDKVVIKKGEKPAEWSEECCINQLIVFCENCMVQDTNAKRCANFLKSLKNRYTWKPSEEQMKALNFVVNLMASSDSLKYNTYYYNLFKDLRKQLKKLREE